MGMKTNIFLHLMKLFKNMYKYVLLKLIGCIHMNMLYSNFKDSDIKFKVSFISPSGLYVELVWYYLCPTRYGFFVLYNFGLHQSSSVIRETWSTHHWPAHSFIFLIFFYHSSFVKNATRHIHIDWNEHASMQTIWLFTT